MNTIDLLRGMILENVLPQFVCKYRAICKSDNEKSIFHLLNESSLWFADAKYFNDPFDCQLNINFESNLYEMEFWIRSIRSFKLSYTDDDIKRKAIELTNDNNKIRTIVDDLIKTNGVCCFSKEYDSILQWSHYADSHKGVCLVFDILKDPLFFNEIFPVDYRVDYQDFNFIKDFNSFVHKRLLPKYKDWEYEKEVRAFNDQIGMKKFEKSALAKIIFGCNISPEEKKAIIQTVLDLNYPNVEFIQAHKNHSEYKLDFFKISNPITLIQHTNLSVI